MSRTRSTARRRASRTGASRSRLDPYQTPSSFYRITLTITDSLGITTVATKDLHPNLTTWSTGANVPGAGYVVDGTWHTGPASIQDVVGVKHVLTGMPYAQIIGGTRYRFSGWADGSALTDSITAAAGGSYTANYDPVSTTVPGPWQSVDVGAPITAGAADYSAGSQTYYVDGAGADAYGKNDQFHSVYQSLAGDGTIIARVRYQTNSDPWAKAGLMIKQSPTAGAAFVDALVTPDVSANTPNINGVACTPNGCVSPLPSITPLVGNGVRMQYSGNHSVTPANLPGYSSPNKWLKLQRAGNNFTSWQSTDGTHWTQIGIATVAMTSPVTIGLFVTYFLIASAPNGTIKVQYNFNGSTGGGTYTFPNVWMKLVRSANTFSAYLSPDGVNWTLVVSKTLAITANATTGLFVCSHNATALGTATFDNVSYTPEP
jgi:regulation of enolase protein 1 (concanavalin A-like superfamily)